MRLQIFHTLIPFLPAALLLSACDTETSSVASGGTALAKVGESVITESDLRKEVQWRRENGQEVPSAEALLQEMVDRQAMVEQAKRSGIADEPGAKRLMETLLIARLREQKLDAELAKAEVSEEELATAYEARIEEFTRKGLDRFAILFQEAHDKMSETRRAESRARLEEAISLIDATPASGGRGPAASGFGQVAIDYSDEQTSRYRGGDIGWLEEDLSESRWPISVLEAGRALEKGKRSGIIDSSDGFYVVMKTDVRPGGRLPLEEVSGGLRQQLLTEKRIEIEKRFVADALKLSKATIDRVAVGKVKLSISPTPVEEPTFPANPSPAASR
jgi:peptidyl-prolyl cis-trans isomerase C